MLVVIQLPVAFDFHSVEKMLIANILQDIFFCV